ncbi:hypothetical protein HanXRQr2_Chr10g0442621 [Helianthus annuus]|uniref:Uncharacterized protein n=1 Tax=Helianthus annuus TaxID=4232 RepID=A0A9K3HY05_HELAN|nr:hypothetical protein HanXRQr2_Chr10g0442621 [Helianthus annuus]
MIDCWCIFVLMASPCTGNSDTTGPTPVVPDDLASLEHEVHMSDVSSKDEDDFQPFALPDGADEPADGPLVEYLPLVVIPAPIPLAVYPAYDLLLDAEANGDVDLFEDGPIEDEIPDAALLPTGDLLMIAGAPAEDSPAHSPVPDSFESVASAPSHEVSAQHFAHDSDPDQASCAAPIPSFAFEHDDIEDSDPIFPPGFDPDQDIEFIPMDQPMEDPVNPVDPVDPIDLEFDFEMAFDDPEPTVAPEPVAASDPVFEHDPIRADVPTVDPLINDVPIDDHPIVAPLLEDEHAVDAHVDAPHIANIPADPVIAPFPDLVPVQSNHSLLAAQVNSRYAHTRSGWINDDNSYPPLEFPVTLPCDSCFSPCSSSYGCTFASHTHH